MISAIFDCVVYFQAILSEHGPAAECLNCCEKDFVQVFICPAIVAELRRVLDRPELRARFRQLTDERVERFLNRVGLLAKAFPDPASIISMERDPKDEPYVNLAIERKATYLVSRDNDLLDLADHAGIRGHHSSLAIVTPEEFLRQVRIKIATDLGYE